jgi:hypothetical protein
MINALLIPGKITGVKENEDFNTKSDRKIRAIYKGA